jgi:glycerate-2-kinase
VSEAARRLLRELFQAGLEAVEPGRAVRVAITPVGTACEVAGLRIDPARCTVIAVGKAAHAMARAWHERLGPPRAGLVVARESGLAPAGWETHVGGHPLPEAASAAAGALALRLAGEAAPDETLVVLLSGGASALLATPLPGVSLADLRALTELLLRSGAEIGELNCVRKHLTAASGGRLALASPARDIAVLALSDVLGDDLGTIGSGPCAPDPTTFADALAVLRRRGIWTAAPAAIRATLERGARGEIDESLKPGAPALARVRSRVIASNARALDAVLAAARARGLEAVLASAALRGEARALGRELAQRALTLRGARDALLVAGGEPSVVVRGSGRGGRCQELALGAALALAGEPGIMLLAAGTDGSDGPTDAAGAFADGETVARGRAAALDARAALADNDAYAFFAGEGGLFRTGPTGTNALDLVLVAVRARS